MFAIIDSPQGVTVFISGKQFTIAPTDRKYDKISKVWESKLSDREKEKALEEILSANLARVLPKGFYQEGNDLYYNGYKLDGVLKQKAQSIFDAGLNDFGPLENFINNALSNESESALNELYKFLSYKELPITPDGYFIAYKGVREDFYSSTGNTRTRVLNGVVDKEGKILNTIGSYIEVERADVNPDKNVHCSYGLHVGSYSYASTFAQKTVVVKVNPKDVVSIPVDCGCQKARCCAYTVVAHCDGEIESPVASVNNNNRIVETGQVFNNKRTDEKIRAYLKRQEENGFVVLRLKKIRNIFSPDYPSASSVLRSLDRLGYKYSVNADSPNLSLVTL